MKTIIAQRQAGRPAHLRAVEDESGAGEARLSEALRRYDVLYTPSNGHFDRLAGLAARLTGAPIAIVSLQDDDEAWFKARHESGAAESGRDRGLCLSAFVADEPWITQEVRGAPAALINPQVAQAFGFAFHASAPLRTLDGETLGVICVVDREPRTTSVDELAQLEALAAVVIDQTELRLAARRALSDMGDLLRTDPLTSLPNRRYFEEHVAREIARSRRDGTPLCVALLDIDHFKRINDDLGHAAGDGVLRHVALLLRDCIRENDFVARWGGEEFALVMGTDGDGARLMLDRVRARIERSAPEATGRTLTVSVGTTLFRTFESVDAALARADEGLYTAKREGRNQVRLV